MKKIMILGAGIYQVPLIKTAKKLGLYTIVVSIPGNYPGFELADKVYYENTVDDEKILEIAKEEQIDGIITTGTDVCVITIGKVCDAMGLAGLSYEADKFDSAMNYVKENTRKDYFLIEEFVEGEEFGAQAFVYNGEVQFILPHGDYVFHGDTGVPIGHFAPYNLNEDVIEDAKEQLRGAVKAMQLDNCAINADFILKDNKTYVLELGGRCGATCLAELTSIYYGFDYYEKILRTALGENPHFTFDKPFVPNASHLLMSDKDGIIKSQVDHNEPNEDICEVEFDYKPGDEVHKFHVGPHRIGHIITKGETLEDAQKLLFEAMDKVEITVE